MPYNLSLLSPDDKYKIELDKQASFLVWQWRNAKVGEEVFEQEIQKLKREQYQQWFIESIEKYKQLS
ncbi:MULTISPECIES: DUF3283 family protein [unclassified Vibrio]|uniref:DUF3283 family protein n=1 Tax=Vibrio sp. HB236076 TaxID=3232307 RepID=A0AB39HG55_9VIBR|nr:DUF3283 family protein [Vibrio sp. HB161653]MDP5252579.1 DUF3283 family protein [Vibrio sp. HB161653]